MRIILLPAQGSGYPSPDAGTVMLPACLWDGMSENMCFGGAVSTLASCDLSCMSPISMQPYQHYAACTEGKNPQRRCDALAAGLWLEVQTRHSSKGASSIGGVIRSMCKALEASCQHLQALTTCVGSMAVCTAWLCMSVYSVAGKIWVWHAKLSL